MTFKSHHPSLKTGEAMFEILIIMQRQAKEIDPSLDPSTNASDVIPSHLDGNGTQDLQMDYSIRGFRKYFTFEFISGEDFSILMILLEHFFE